MTPKYKREPATWRLPVISITFIWVINLMMDSWQGKEFSWMSFLIIAGIIILAQIFAPKFANKGALSIELDDNLVIRKGDAVLWRKASRTITEARIKRSKSWLALTHQSLLISCSDNDSYCLPLDYLSFEDQAAEQQFLASVNDV
ncbi:hypothetical protein HII17_09750 [Thalassotalea sp. M1531]|uniref:Uncharacterized protein n=1 Tax=Thalassotalea algicola TaxID=2716224 RepID=A0A7Y0Q6W7_9GAMM|nr:hypothetical protein [Thalassotalea algicola]NMP31848.1 hypothetical protein [Thalassotalea algicola]